MWTFCKIKLKQFKDFPTEWVIRIDNIEGLFEYFQKVHGNLDRGAFIAYTEHMKTKQHYTNQRANVTHFLAEIKETTFLDALSALSSATLKGMCDVLLKGHILYVREIGSYTFDTKKKSKYKVLSTLKRDIIVFPKNCDGNQVKIKKWPNGKHWYAQVGNVDVEWCGERKWKTRKMAEYAVKKFLEKK